MNLRRALPSGRCGDHKLTPLYRGRQSSLSGLASLPHERGRSRLHLARKQVSQGRRVIEILILPLGFH